MHQIDRLARKLKPGSDPAFLARYVGSVDHEKRRPDERSTLEFLGLTTPQINALYDEVVDGRHVGGYADWEKLWHESRVYELKSLALGHLIELRKKEADVLRGLGKKLAGWVSTIDNWAHSDMYSSVLAHLREVDPKTWDPIFARWSRSKNPWERRQSLISLFYYATQRKTQPPAALVFDHLERLVKDPHFYVQRAVGWTLREAYRVYPERQLAFVRKHVGEIGPSGWFATTERYSPKLKAEFKRARKEALGSKRAQARHLAIRSR